MILIFEKNMKFPLLLDIYGSLLSDRRRELVEYYYNDDYSLAEISEITGLSRQGVRDSIKKSEDEIYSLEEKLGIARKNRLILDSLDRMEKSLPQENGISSIRSEIISIRSLIRTDDTDDKSAST